MIDKWRRGRRGLGGKDHLSPGRIGFLGCRQANDRLENESGPEIGFATRGGVLRNRKDVDEFNYAQRHQSHQSRSRRHQSRPQERIANGVRRNVSFDLHRQRFKERKFRQEDLFKGHARSKFANDLTVEHVSKISGRHRVSDDLGSGQETGNCPLHGGVRHRRSAEPQYLQHEFHKPGEQN